jgi:4-amino-4-deoxy-L-arabinose transferase-like glycosyltransferase
MVQRMSSLSPPATTRRLAALVGLALAAFVAQDLALSAARLQPRYDEVHYVSLARDYARMGGAAAAVRCYFQGRCRDDNRYPLYDLVLQPFAHDAPSFYADAKLVTLGTGLLLFAVVGLVSRRTFSAVVAAASVCLLALMPALGEITSGVIGDVLFAALMVLATYLLSACQGRRAGAWLGAGAVVGLAYLTKGNGHLTLVALFTLSAVLHRRRLLARPDLYAAGVGFVITALFLLWRNRIVYGNPFHNFNDHSAWLDGWKETWAYLHSPEWNRIGLGWYLRRHSVVQLAWRVTQGLGKTVGALVYTSGLGITAATPVSRDATVAEALPRVLTGLGVLVLAALGLRERHRAGHRAEVLAITHVLFWFVLAFAVGGQGVGMATRFMLPMTAILVPHAAFALVTRIRRKQQRWPAPVVAALVIAPLAVKLLWFAPGAVANPRAAYAVPADWAETSAWLAANLHPGERYAIAHTSLYSTWDRPRPDPDARWIGLFTAPADELLREMAQATPLSIAPRWDGPPIPVTKALIDAQDRAFVTYADKLSAARDPHGPLQFLGWPRCFSDSGTPSRFSIYCRP